MCNGMQSVYRNVDPALCSTDCVVQIDVDSMAHTCTNTRTHTRARTHARNHIVHTSTICRVFKVTMQIVTNQKLSVKTERTPCKRPVCIRKKTQKKRHTLAPCVQGDYADELCSRWRESITSVVRGHLCFTGTEMGPTKERPKGIKRQKWQREIMCARESVIPCFWTYCLVN